MKPSTISIAKFSYRGANITFRSIPGVVLAGDRTVSKETHISGGGGHVPASGGYVVAPKLHTTTTENQELWIRDESGRDVRFMLAEYTAPVLAGQSVVMVVGETGGSARDVPTMLMNLSAEERHELMGMAALLAFIDPPQNNPRMWLVWLVAIVGCFCAFLLFNAVDRYNPMQVWFGMAILGTPLIAMLYSMFARIAFHKRFIAAHGHLRSHLYEETRPFFMR